MNKIKPKRLGRFSVSMDLIEENPEVCRDLMGKCIIVRAEAMYHVGRIDYVALSPDFNEVQEGEYIPEYGVRVHRDGESTEIEFTDLAKKNSTMIQAGIIAEGIVKDALENILNKS